MTRKIIILLLSSHKYPSPRNEKIQQKTWINDAKKFDIEVINFIGGFPETAYEKPYLRLTSKDSIEDVGYKTLESFEWCLENKEFDYIFRVNSSSYVNIEELIKYINSINSDYVYSGKIIDLDMLNISFISGSGIIFNKLTIKKIVNNKELWDHSLIDDLAIGKLMKFLQITPSEGNFFEINKNAFSYKNVITSYHIRCKLEDYGYPRFLESYNMLYLHKIQKNIQITTFTKKISIIIFKIIKILNFKFYLNKYILRNRHLRNRLRHYKNILTRKSVG